MGEKISILEALEKVVESIKAWTNNKFVKTVNGVKPDDNGNITVSGTGGGSQIYVGAGEMPPDYTVQIDPTVEMSVVTTVNGVAPDENGNVEVVGGAGKDGVSVQHSWNGTVLTVTSASGTSSSDLKGADGKDGQNGSDYTLTDSDKQEIAEQAAGMVEIPSGYATEDYVKNKIAEAQLGGADGSDIDLSGFATKDDLVNKVNTTDIIDMAHGGTGRNFANVPPYAIIRATSDLTQYPYLYYTSTKSGALYATEENGAPRFGSLPVAQGGTGATTAEAARATLGITPANIGAIDTKMLSDALAPVGRNLVKTSDPFSAKSNVTTRWQTVILQYKEDKDTYFNIAATENLVDGEQYVLSFDCTGVPADMHGKKLEFMVGKTNYKSVFTLANGRMVIPFIADGKATLLFDDSVSSAGYRPNSDIVGEGIFLSNFCIEKGSFSLGYQHKFPVLTTEQKNQIQALAKRYHEVAKKKETFYYDGNTVQNDYANTRCWRKYETEEKSFYRFAMCCNTFCEALWMGRDVSDFAEVEKDENGTITKIKNKDKYSHKITKAFNWGYMFGFEDRKKIAGVAERDSDGTIVNYYGYQNPNGYKSDNYTNSYSVNSIYDPEVTNTTKYPKLQWFSSFQTQADAARELYEKGYVIPYEELDIGDLVFIKPRHTLNSDYETFKNNYQWKNISHVAMVYDKAADGTLTFIDCTNVDYDEPVFIFSTEAGYGDQWVARAMNTKNNVVMCARHPAAWGKNNMANIDRIDYVPMRYTTGYSTGQAKPFTAGMAVTEGLWYVCNNELGQALVTGVANEWKSCTDEYVTLSDSNGVTSAVLKDKYKDNYNAEENGYFYIKYKNNG